MLPFYLKNLAFERNLTNLNKGNHREIAQEGFQYLPVQGRLWLK